MSHAQEVIVEVFNTADEAKVWMLQQISVHGHHCIYVDTKSLQITSRLETNLGDPATIAGDAADKTKHVVLCWLPG